MGDWIPQATKSGVNIGTPAGDVPMPLSIRQGTQCARFGSHKWCTVWRVSVSFSSLCVSQCIITNLGVPTRVTWSLQLVIGHACGQMNPDVRLQLVADILGKRKGNVEVCSRGSGNQARVSWDSGTGFLDPVMCLVGPWHGFGGM
jgi:hypothetical protein